MISKNDLLLLLTEIGDKGINVDSQMTSLFKSAVIPVDVIKFINSQRQFDIANFYTLLRKNYNNKKSKLYINLVKENIEDPNAVLTTLSSLVLQILLFAKKLPEEDKMLFLKESRGDEITKVLNNYFVTYDLIPCMNLLKVIKADLKLFEGVTK